MPNTGPIYPDGSAGMGWTNPGNITTNDGNWATKTLGAEEGDSLLQATFSASYMATQLAAIIEGSTINSFSVALEGGTGLDGVNDATVDLTAKLDGTLRSSVEGATLFDLMIPDPSQVYTRTFAYAADRDDFLSDFVIGTDFNGGSDGASISVDRIYIADIDYTLPSGSGSLLLVGVGI